MISWVWFFETLWTIVHRGLLSMEFFWKECWRGLSFPSPGDLSDPGTVATSLVSPTLAGSFFTPGPPGKPQNLPSETYSLQRKTSDFIEVNTGGHLGQTVEADIPSDTYRPHVLPQQPPSTEQEERHPFYNANPRSNQEKQPAPLGWRAFSKITDEHPLTWRSWKTDNHRSEETKEAKG